MILTLNLSKNFSLGTYFVRGGVIDPPLAICFKGFCAYPQANRWTQSLKLLRLLRPRQCSTVDPIKDNLGWIGFVDV